MENEIYLFFCNVSLICQVIYTYVNVLILLIRNVLFCSCNICIFFGVTHGMVGKKEITVEIHKKKHTHKSQVWIEFNFFELYLFGQLMFKKFQVLHKCHVFPVKFNFTTISKKVTIQSSFLSHFDAT
jgi:hypothetical protein